MKIKTYLNTNEKEVKSKKFNIFIGISLGNRYFSKENIKKYILWAIENTKNDVLVLIADQNHAINYEILNNYKPKRALNVALTKGKEVKSSIEKIIRSLPKENRGLVKVARWNDVRKSKYYKEKIKLILKEFKHNKRFHDFIIKIARKNLGKKSGDLSKKKLERLSLYVLDELPIILNGLEFEGKIYNLHPYPGLTLLDDLLMGLQNKTLFSKLAEKLQIKNKIAVIEAYVN